MNQTKIEYLDFTWNPAVGCTGKGCAAKKVCWAARVCKRFKKRCDLCYSFFPHYHFERLNQPLARKKSARIGVCFNADLFDTAFGIVSVQQIFKVMRDAVQHTFVLLTKQSKNLLTFNKNWCDFPKNVWVGVTVNIKKDLLRIADLKQTDAVVKFVSFEPLYEDLGAVDLSGIDWVIIGGQTRPSLIPNGAWIANLMSRAWVLKIPVFSKNNLPNHSCQQFPELKESFKT